MIRNAVPVCCLCLDPERAGADLAARPLRMTWLVIAAHTQLRLARVLTAELRRPWERPCPPGRLTRPTSAVSSVHSDDRRTSPRPVEDGWPRPIQPKNHEPRALR